MGIFEAIAPQYALKRELARQKLNVIKNYHQGGAASNNNALRSVRATANSPREDIEDNLEQLQALSRNAFMVNPLASGAIKKMRTNVVGSGLALSPKPDGKFLGLSGDDTLEWERTVRREFNIWANKTDCDACGRLNFGQLQGIAFLSALVNGDVFTLLPTDQKLGQPYDLRVKLIEADRVRTPTDKSSDENIVSGIELDQNGKSIAAHIANTSAGESKSAKFIRVPFYDGEIPLVLHLAQDWERVGQVRGVGVLVPIMEVLVQLDRYTKAELAANIIAAMMTVFIKSENDVGSLADGIPLDQQVAPQDDSTIELGSGNIIGLAQGEDITTVNGGRPNGAFDSVMTAYIRQLGVGLEMPYEVLLGHFQSSYSAARGALQEAWKMYMMRRDWLVKGFCQPIYEQWLAEAVAKGRVQAHGFFNDPAIKAAWCGTKWIGPAQTSLNPTAEASANKTNVEMGFTTREMVIQQSNGMTFDQVTDTLTREYEARQKAGLEGVENEMVAN